jgi:CDP-diacylglycerol---serine O-phosphatidyltransferase
MKTLFSVPNLFSLANLLCGCIATLNIIEGNLYTAAFLIGIASVCDFLDGFAARGLKQGSPMGKELDSLADMVTFGVVPGMMMFQLIRIGVNLESPHHLGIASYFPYVGFIIPLFSGLRLAKFNVDTRQSESFIGLPTLANAIFISGLPFLINYDQVLFRPVLLFPFNRDFLPSTFGPMRASIELLFSPWVMITVTILFSILLLSPIPMFSFKVKNVKWKGNEIRYVFLILCLILVLIFQLKAISCVIVLYILLSIFHAVLKRR